MHFHLERLEGSVLAIDRDWGKQVSRGYDVSAVDTNVLKFGKRDLFGFGVSRYCKSCVRGALGIYGTAPCLPLRPCNTPSAVGRSACLSPTHPYTNETASKYS